jgi:PKHD-type hydroxylase
MIPIYVQKVFTKKLCEKIISCHSNWNERVGYVGENKINPNIRHCKTYMPSPIENMETDWIENEIVKIVFITNAKTYNFNLSGDFEFQLLRYDLGGHYKTHIDIGTHGATLKRKISFTLLLNDSYEGGELNFDNEEKSKSNLEIGDMILFPSFLPHKVEPITSGVRWSLVGWSLGDKHFV